MRTTPRIAIPAVLAVLALAVPASAHVPFFSTGQYYDAEHAYPVRDPQVSLVMYHEVTCDAPVLWMTFEASAGESLELWIAVPKLDRLKDDRPTLALLGPGLPPAEGLPVAVPEGAGAMVFPTAGLPLPDVYFEGFTRTYSWVLRVETPTVEAGGRYWLAAWPGEWRTGKLWVVIGTAEDFTDIQDLDLTELMERIDVFHEVAGEVQKLETACEAPVVPPEPTPEAGPDVPADLPADAPGPDLAPSPPSGSGDCAAGAAGTPLPAVLLLAGLAWRACRRRLAAG